MLDSPGSADAADHPSQNRPEIQIHDRPVERLERIHDGMDLNARWEEFTASADENKRVKSRNSG
jgi:hypothetical protein